MPALHNPSSPPPSYEAVTSYRNGNSIDSGDKRQQCSRLMKITSNGRPYSKDFLELFSTMVISTNFSRNRYRFSYVENSCTLLQLLSTLENLQLSQVNRIKSRCGSKVLKSTTKFTIPKTAAKCLCNTFLNARLLQIVNNPSARKFSNEKCLLQLTRKGYSVVSEFLQHNGHNSQAELYASKWNHSAPVIVSISRFSSTDQILKDSSFCEMLLVRMLGSVHEIGKSKNPLLVPVYSVSSPSPKDSLSKVTKYQMFGIDIAEWLMCNTMLLDWSEMETVASDLLIHSYIAYENNSETPLKFSYAKGVSYFLTGKGIATLGWTKNVSNNKLINKINEVEKGSTNKEILETILRKPNLQTYFFEFLKKNFCDENQRFYSEVCEFNDYFSHANETNDHEAIRESFAHACGIYNCFLSSNAPNAVNLPSDLYEKITNHMALAMEVEPLNEWLQLIHILLLEAQTAVLDLMAGDSLLKFLELNGGLGI
ncbi:regulator of G-protein signaling Rgs1 [Schizosaccharomyces pombe]|uniref:Regulator of G-protein signaling 1 n=1 Tax=Schizosaccharomyces pombe (strain 972 / ATCC 24843) TaxID=284812 RepID=RGS1_SCHPO|nr:G-protein-signaling regulator Rgs1 [Schizosaccharomyces pombe]Q09777.1 RecName: Full=Regulator of G-protein signaling 1 [Schizosaccharomyces pombe 972h-]CAA91077.1 regulator of G-protein signaling Rgs1 [Schizosaccharomyces pombe]|eukprot:NP_593029.1 G-protein-signaling regulator Rgs1 [Schizosaccharomyces pombe]